MNLLSNPYAYTFVSNLVLRISFRSFVMGSASVTEKPGDEVDVFFYLLLLILLILVFIIFCCLFLHVFLYKNTYIRNMRLRVGTFNCSVVKY